jgi:predicted nucleic acid-binding protein
MKAYIHARLTERDRATLAELKRKTGLSESELVRRGRQLVARSASECSRRAARHWPAGRAFVEGRPASRSRRHCAVVRRLWRRRCFLLRKAHEEAPAELMALAERGVFSIAIAADEHGAAIKTLLQRYASRPISLADACLIRCADVHQEKRILTFDADFAIYRWARQKRFRIAVKRPVLHR